VIKLRGADMVCTECFADGHCLSQWHKQGSITSRVQRVMTGQCALLVMFVLFAGNRLMNHGKLTFM